jgi:ATP-binding cassette subfamily B protein
MITSARNITWPASRLGEALDALVRRSGLSTAAAETRNPGVSTVRDRAALSRWVETATASLHLEAEPASVGYSEL